MSKIDGSASGRKRIANWWVVLTMACLGALLLTLSLLDWLAYSRFLVTLDYR